MLVSKILRDTQRNLDVSIDAAMSLLKSSDQWRRAIKGKYRPILNGHRHDIAAMAFFRMYLAWEDFLEEAFLILLVKAKRGTRGARSLLDVDSRREAFTIVKGEKRPYVDWSVAKDIRDRAATFFKEGKPFEVPLAAGSLHLERMRRIRNRIAHRSKHAEDQFRELIRELFGAYRRETPGSLLLHPPPTNFGLPSHVIPGPTVVQTYADILKAIAYQIVK